MSSTYLRRGQNVSEAVGAWAGCEFVTQKWWSVWLTLDGRAQCYLCTVHILVCYHGRPCLSVRYVLIPTTSLFSLLPICSPSARRSGDGD